MRIFAKFNVSNIDTNYRGQILIPVDSIVSISTFSTVESDPSVPLHMRSTVTTSIIYFKISTNEMTHVFVNHSVDDIEQCLRSIE